jgi:hypothetical protein
MSAGRAARLSARTLALLALGWAVWIALMVRLIPYDCKDLCYLFSLERDHWVMQEWVHPLHVPALRLLQALVRLAGWRGGMLFPVEYFHVALGASALAVVFAVVRRHTGDAAVAAACACLLSTSRGFVFGCVRPTPYAAASLATAASLALLLVPGRWSAPLRYRLSGAAAGLAASFHLSALSLLPAAFWACSTGPDTRARRGSIAVGFSAAFLGVLGLAYAALWTCHPWMLGSVWSRASSRLDLMWMFSSIEQVPGSSLYTNPHPLRQAWALSGNVFHQGGVLVAMSCLAALMEPPWRSEWPVRTVWIAALCFAGFFFVNNSANGFVFAGLLLLPLAVGAWASGSRARRKVLFAAAAVSAALWAGYASAVARKGDPFAGEARFLRESLGPNGLLIVPGCPSPELFYFGHFHAVAVDGGGGSLRCAAPVEAFGSRLLGRIERAQKLGGKVLLALGGDGEEPAKDPSVALKEGRGFDPWSTDASLQTRFAARLAEGLAGSGSETFSSPEGWRYLRVGSARARRRSDADKPLPFADGFPASFRAEYLRDWLAADPEDPFARADLSALSGLWGDLRPPQAEP